MALEFLPIRKGTERRVDDNDGIMRRPSLFSSLVSDGTNVARHL